MKTTLILLAMGATACVKSANGTLDGVDAQTAGNSLAGEIEEGASGFGPVAMQGAADASCVTLSGNTADTDLDSIPASATLTFACTATQGGYTGMVTGTEMVTDTDPSAASWNFSAEADLHLSLTAPGGASLTNDRTGTIAGSQASGSFGLDRSLASTTTLTAANGANVSMEESVAWTVTYKPSITWTPGAVVVAGTVGASGTWDVTLGGNTAAAILDTPTPLTFSPSCATRVTGGTLNATYLGGGHMNTLAVTWTGCGTRTVVYTAK